MEDVSGCAAARFLMMRKMSDPNVRQKERNNVYTIVYTTLIDPVNMCLLARSSEDSTIQNAWIEANIIRQKVLECTNKEARKDMDDTGR